MLASCMRSACAGSGGFSTPPCPSTTPWKTTNAWTDVTKTYEEFEAELSELYPGASGDR